MCIYIDDWSLVYSVGGSLPVIFPYIAEFTRNKYRGPYLGVQAFFWTFGRLVCGGFAWVILPLSFGNIHSWRVFIAASAVPSLIGALLYFFLPESPRFLLEVRRREGDRGVCDGRRDKCSLGDGCAIKIHVYSTLAYRKGRKATHTNNECAHSCT